MSHTHLMDFGEALSDEQSTVFSTEVSHVIKKHPEKKEKGTREGEKKEKKV